MNEKRITLVSCFICLIVILLIYPQKAFSQIVVSWSLQTDNVAEDGLNGNALFSTFLHSSGQSVNYDSNGASISGWESQQYWYTSSFTTTGLKDIYFTVQMMSDATGPRDFQLQYKIGSGSWNNIGSVIQLTSNQSGINNISLPDECSNQPEISLRLNRASSISVSNGTILPSAYSYIRYVEVGGAEPTAPTTQASSISVVSVTPTTITLTANTGNGTNWVLFMNTVNAFTVPQDNTNPTGNLSYSGSGVQLMANVPANTKTITVTVPAATNQYYFRAYAYNYNDGMTRYRSTTATSNPKLCALEVINNPTVTNIRLTTATLGATITTPTKTTVSERGIYWGTSPNITTNNAKLSQTSNPGGGTFSINATNLTRSSVVYFKAYATNGSGTILSEEVSFSNVPVITGTGDWENANNWNVQQVPGSGTTYGSISDEPIINGNCTLSSTTSCTNLTINAGQKLTISPAAFLKITSKITNNAGNSGILIKSSNASPNGSLIFNNSAGNPVSATVEMYSKAKWDLTKPTGSKYSWQFFGLPVKTLPLNPTFSGAWVRKWEETGQTDVDLWVMQNTGATLSSITGYELVQSAAKTYSFAGQLENQNFSRSLPYTSGAVYPGQHIFANPFTAAIDIESIVFGTNTENSLYLYNTGTYNEWDSNSGETITGEGHGQYTVTTPQASGGLGVPSQIPSMQGFLVKSTNATGSITIPYATSVANTDRQRTKANNEVAKSAKVVTRIDIKSTHYSDRMWIFTDPACNRSFDNGWDGPKMLGSSQRSQIFSMEEDGNYQINAVRDINDTYIGLLPGEDKDFKLIFTHQNIQSNYSGLFLIDLVENKTMDITTSGSEYSFTSTPSIDITKRFKIITKPTENIYNYNKSDLKLFHSNSAIFVHNFSNIGGSLIIYKTNGATLKRINFNANTVASFSTIDLQPGIYLAKAVVDNEEITQRIIIR